MSDQKKPEPTFSIGDLASELGVTTRTIRYYEERGLIAPQRSNGRQRIYTRKDRGRLKLLLRAKGIGFDLEEIKEVFQIYETNPTDIGEQQQFRKLHEMLTRRLAEVRQKKAELEQLEATLENYLQAIQQTRLEQDQELE